MGIKWTQIEYMGIKGTDESTKMDAYRQISPYIGIKGTQTDTEISIMGFALKGGAFIPYLHCSRVLSTRRSAALQFK